MSFQKQINKEISYMRRAKKTMKLPRAKIFSMKEINKFWNEYKQGWIMKEFVKIGEDKYIKYFYDRNSNSMKLILEEPEEQEGVNNG